MKIIPAHGSVFRNEMTVSCIAEGDAWKKVNKKLASSLRIASIVDV